MLSRRVWSALILLGFAGQLAWAVENQFFNGDPLRGTRVSCDLPVSEGRSPRNPEPTA